MQYPMSVVFSARLQLRGTWHNLQGGMRGRNCVGKGHKQNEMEPDQAGDKPTKTKKEDLYGKTLPWGAIQRDDS